MAIRRTCNRCHKPISIGKQCEYCRAKYQKEYDAQRPEHHDYYHTAEWDKARKKAIEKTHGLDIYSLYVDGVIEYGNTVHHITPLEDDYSKRADQSNLIYLSEHNHKRVHSQYKTNQRAEENKLRALLIRFEKEYNE